MSFIFKGKKELIGKSAEELVFVGEKRQEVSTIDLIRYSREKIVEIEDIDARECPDHLERGSVTWLNIQGLHDLELIRRIGKGFDLHPLILEDIVHTGQRPRVEEHENCLFIISRILYFNRDEGHFTSEQLSMILGKGFVLTFQERKGRVFEPVRERIRKNKGRLRLSGSDYLAYALLDTLMDDYIWHVERVGALVDETEDQILEEASDQILSRVYENKKQINDLRKTINPLNDVVNYLCRKENEFIKEDTLIFLKDLKGMTAQTIDTINTYREMLSDQLNIYNAGVSNKLNEIMKVLTIFSAIFIPLSFLAGVYGTNFDHMPEIHFKFSYFIFWGVIITVVVLMLRYFKKKGWI